MNGTDAPEWFTALAVGVERPLPPPRHVHPLDRVVDELLRLGSSDAIGRAMHRPTPSREQVAHFLRLVRGALLPGHDGAASSARRRFELGAILSRACELLAEQAALALAAAAGHGEGCTHCLEAARAISDAFLAALPEVRRRVGADVAAAFCGDPALTSADEAILCYPGISAVASQRLAHLLHAMGLPLVPRMMTETAHSETGIDIHPGACLGEHLFIDHGTGVVIGETAVVGNRVRIYQGVTLGARSFPLDEGCHPVKGLPRHPVIEDDVVIYSGASILGRITIGRGSVIGGSVWVTKDVPPGSVVNQRTRERSTAPAAACGAAGDA